MTIALDRIDTAAAADLPASAFSRVGDGTAGYFYCGRRLALEPGQYRAEVAADLAADAPSVSLEALDWRGDESEFLARTTLTLSPRLRERSHYTLTFAVYRAATVELRGYLPAGLAASSLKRLRLVRTGEPGAVGAYTPSAVAPPDAAWPIDHIRHIVVGTTSVCNASCTHCPTNKASTKHLGRAPMPWDLFAKFVDGVRDTGFAVRGQFSFGLFAEGLLDPLVVERSRYVKAHLPGVHLSINSNGGPASPALAEALGAVADGFNFHIEAVTPAVYEDLMRPLKASTVFPKVADFIKRCGKPVHISCPVSTKNVGELAEIRDYWMERGAGAVVFSPLSSRCSDDLRYDELALAPKRGDCREDVAADLIVDADGTVLSCCNDFARVHPIGDLTRETVAGLLGNASRKHLYDELQARRFGDFETCRNCRFDSEDSLKQFLPA